MKFGIRAEIGIPIMHRDTRISVSEKSARNASETKREERSNRHPPAASSRKPGSDMAKAQFNNAGSTLRVLSGIIPRCTGRTPGLAPRCPVISMALADARTI
jgi:hypothetical protein